MKIRKTLKRTIDAPIECVWAAQVDPLEDALLFHTTESPPNLEAVGSTIQVSSPLSGPINATTVESVPLRRHKMHWTMKLWPLMAWYRSPEYDIAVDMEPAGNATEVTIVVNTKARAVTGAFGFLLLVLLCMSLPPFGAIALPGAMVATLVFGVPFIIWLTYFDCLTSARLALGRLKRGVAKRNLQQTNAISLVNR